MSLGMRGHAGRQTNQIGRPTPILSIGATGRLDWTFLRPSGFAVNTIALFAPRFRGHGAVRWPDAAAARSLIDERDMAAVAGRALA